MLPPETLFAIFPPSAAEETGRALGFHAVSISHLAAMETMGIDLDKEIDDDHALVAAWILSHEARMIPAVIEGKCDNSANFEAWAKGCDASMCEIKKAVEAALNIALSTIVQSEKINGATTRQFEQTGLGWLLELAEWFASEYKVSFDEAIQQPIVRVFACVACARQRNGGKHGSPDYYEKHRLKEFKEALKGLQESERREENGTGREC